MVEIEKPRPWMIVAFAVLAVVSIVPEQFADLMSKIFGG